MSFRYTGYSVLDDITFHIRKGEILGIVGPSGSGKTTMLRLLLRGLSRRFIDESDGEKLFDSTIFTNPNHKVRISYVPQS